MKKFYLKSILFFLIVSALFGTIVILSTKSPFNVICAYITNSVSYLNEDIGPDEIICYIEDAQIEDGKEILIIGDSVCRQMFKGLSEKNDNISFLANNGGATLAVQYIIAEEWINAHPNAKKVYLMVLPLSIGRTFDTTYGYQYVAIPLVKTKLLDKLEPETIKQLKHAYGSAFLNEETVNLVNESAMNKKIYLNYMRNKGGYKLNYHYELADIYIPKMKELCDENQVELYVYPCPVPDNRIDYIETLKKQYYSTKMYDAIPYYYDYIYFYDSVESEGDLHFAGDYANQDNYNNIISEWLKDGDILNELKF